LRPAASPDPDPFPDGKYPPNTLLIVDRLVKEQCVVEVQTIAAL
jgi:hypothetical protein